MITMDVYDNLHPDERAEFNSWLRDLDLFDVGVVAVESIGDGRCRFTLFDRDDQGRVQADANHDPILTTVEREVAVLPACVSRWGAGDSPPAVSAVEAQRDELVAADPA